MSLHVLTWSRDHEPEFPQCVTLAQKYLHGGHGTGTGKVILRQNAKLKNISIFQNEIQFSLKTVFNIRTSATFSEFILSANSKLYRVYIGKHWA